MDKPTTKGDYPKRVTNGKIFLRMILNSCFENKIEVDIDIQIHKVSMEYELGQGKAIKDYVSFLFEKGYLSGFQGTITISKLIDL